MAPKVSKDLRKLSKAISNGSSIQQAALEAGYSKSRAAMGIKGLPKAGQAIVLRHARRLEAISKQFTPDTQEHFIRGALIENVIEGKDRAAQSLKLLGSDKRVNMFSAESVTGVFIIEMPGHLAKSVQPQVLDSKDIPE